MTYVTPELFRTMGVGIDLTDVEDIQLRSSLYRASAAVDSYCNVPLQPQKFDFRGGTITEEAHEWPLDPYEVTPRPFRFWPWHKPVKTVSQFRIYATPNVYVEIDADEVFINNSAGYVEVSSLKLTQYGVFGTGIVTTLIGLHNPVAKVSYTYGYSFAVTGEQLEPTDFEVYRAQNQWWDAATTPVVKKNGTTVSSSNYVVDANEGTITFTAGLTATDVVTLDYAYTMPWQIQHATAILAAADLGESGLRAKGMVGVDSLKVGEITIRRSAPPGQRGGTMISDALPETARVLLSGFVFDTIR